MVRRWQTDLCVVSDENGTMEITNNCVVCYRLSCILVTCHIIPSSSLFATQSVSCLHCRLFHMPRPSNPQTNKPTNTPGWEASDAHCSLFIHSRQACMQILYLFTGKWWVKFIKIESLTSQTRAESSHCIVTWRDCKAQCNILFIALSICDSEFEGKHLFQFFTVTSALEDKDSNILYFLISWKDQKYIYIYRSY